LEVTAFRDLYLLDFFPQKLGSLQSVISPNWMDSLACSGSVAELLHQRAARQNDALAYVFLENGEREGGRLTYAILDRQARGVAAILQDMGMAGNRILLIYPSGLEFIAAYFGCLYAGAVAVPTPAPTLLASKRGLQRLRAIAEDVRPAAILTDDVIASRLAGVASAALQTIPCLSPGSATADLASLWRQESVPGGRPAHIQYTSGSTADPKGVMVSHENLLQNLASLDEAWRHDESSVLVSWLPMFHDMGLIYGVLQGLYSGCTSYLMAPFAFLREPIRVRALTPADRSPSPCRPNRRCRRRPRRPGTVGFE
jgi:acyl-CoA synthetase (AMP-forming)/AMP-acid ligase II